MIRDLSYNAKDTNKFLKSYIKKQSKTELIRPMKYGLLPGGKKIRSKILIDVGKIFNLNYKNLIQVGAAVECIHAYSLIHDDLPCMDNDSLRRGKPTVHLAFSEANALLGGSSLLVFAFQILSMKAFKLEEKSKIKNIGGLFVIGTERHESRRIDNQLRGRSGRQGDEGNSIFYISLEDDLMRIFGSESIDSIMKKFGLKEGESIDHPWINKALERAQQRVEARNFDIRKTLLKFDDVMNDQRKVVFEQRKEILKSQNIDRVIVSFQEDLVKNFLNEKAIYERENQVDAFKIKIKSIFGFSLSY